jgi:hypothetical protein
MPEFFKRRWIFFVLTVLAVFFVVFSHNIFSKTTEILNQVKFFQAGLADAPAFKAPLAEEPDKSQGHFDGPATISPEASLGGELVFVAEDLNPKPLTQQEIQEQLDDIAEKIDILEQEVAELTGDPDIQQSENTNLENADLKTDDEKKEETIEKQEQLPEEPESNQQYVAVVNPSKPSYLKILISEVQVGGQEDNKQEFVELFNPNEEDVDLTDWYLQRKTATGSDYSSYAPNSLLAGKKIFAKNYFLICREDYNPGGACNVGTAHSLSEDNTLILKNPNREIADKVGFGAASDFEAAAAQNPAPGQSIGRKWIDNTEQDSDNNLLDFEINTLTPKANNIVFIEPLAPVLPPTLKNIFINEVQIGDSQFIELYNPNSTEIDLTDWYLQRKTATGSDYSSFITKTQFLGKKINANDYFLIARQGSIYEGAADIVTDDPITENNSLVLKNSDEDISDKLGFGSAQDFETAPAQGFLADQSLGRKFDEASQNYLDTGDNSADFEINSPTPKAKNTAFVETPLLELVGIEIKNPPDKLVYNIGENLDIIGLLATGIYSDGSIQDLAITLENVSGFDSSSVVSGQVLTILVQNFIANFMVDIVEPKDTTPPAIIIYTISNQIISPNEDGVKDDTDIDLDFSEKVKVNVDIVDSNGAVIVEDFYKSSKVTNPNVKTWSGEDSSGVVADGVYTIKVSLEDHAGNKIEDISKTITVDNTAPVITLSGDATINLVVGDSYEELGATIVDENIDNSALIIGGDIVDTASSGTFIVTYDATDFAENNAEQIIRTVIVNEIPAVE